jgi:hypothetical protein
MRPLALLLTLVAATASYATDIFRFEPAAPTSTSAVFLRVETVVGACVPRNAQVTRNGQSIDVSWTVAGQLCADLVLVPWSDRVFLGALPPGTYNVTMRVDSRSYGTKTLTVADGAPAFQLNPPRCVWCGRRTRGTESS